MKKYAILCHPQALKTYKENAGNIFINEFIATAKALDTEINAISFTDIAGISYLMVETQKEPSDAFFSKMARLSFFFALFEKKGEMLLPKHANPNYIFQQNMPALLNYRGKTNEFFTRLMINLALSACGTETQGRKALLDPVAGKCTTLHDALMLGINAYGIELSEKYFIESCHYAAKFLQNEKFKHITKKDKILDVKSRKIADAYALEFAADKKSFNAKDLSIFKVFKADTRIADKLIKKNSIDMIVGDLPYGIHHANKKASKKSEKSRNTEELFGEALSSWLVSLKKGGSLIVSFNEHTTSKEKLAVILEQNSMKILKEDEYYNYRHQVDASIKRDLLVAVKL